MSRPVKACDCCAIGKAVRLLVPQSRRYVAVGEAADGKKAIAAVRRHRPDLVLMDIPMPNLEGIEATREILSTGASSRVVILTTFDLDEHVFAALRAGASGFLLRAFLLSNWLPWCESWPAEKHFWP